MGHGNFLGYLHQSFQEYAQHGGRSTKKLADIHGGIARDLHQHLPTADYEVHSMGYGEGKEKTLPGYYMNKRVDITVLRNHVAVAAVGVKFVMSNYQQNAANYFENMLGETANLRVNDIPYYQILAMPDAAPYFQRDETKTIKRWETLTEAKLDRYTRLSNTNQAYLHTPTTMLMYIVSTGADTATPPITNAAGFETYIQNPHFHVTPSTRVTPTFGPRVVLNDYERFLRQLSKDIHTTP